MAWAFQLKPLNGELLTSYLARVAHGHGAAPGAFCRFHLGDSWYFTRDLDRGVASRTHELLASLSGLSLAEIRKLTLSSWLRSLTPASRGRKEEPAITPWVNVVGIDQSKRRYRALAYCPKCLEQGAALKSWRLTFHVWCRSHKCCLLDSCSRCGAAFVPHLSRRKVANCYRCGAPLGVDAGTQNGLASLGAQELQADMDDWLLGACGGDEMSGSRLYELRILVSKGMRAFNLSPRAEVSSSEPCSARSRSRLECMRVSDRRSVMDWLSKLVVGWPSTFREFSKDAGLTQRSFARSGLDRMKSTWLSDEVRRLPPGFTRCRTGRAALSKLPPQMQRGAANWRAERAELLLKKVRKSGD